MTSRNLLWAAKQPAYRTWCTRGGGTKADNGRWLLSEAQGLGASVSLEAVGCALELEAVYERVIQPV